MDRRQLLEARKQFRERLGSLDNDIQRAFYPIQNGPGYAPFPAAMYAFATIDYFSSFWAGWNQFPPDRSTDQTNRMTAFLTDYLLYPVAESTLAIKIWRHKLMHTAEPRLLKGKGRDKGRRYAWLVGSRTDRHWQLVPHEKDGQLLRLHVGLVNLAEDLREGVFGPSGYFEALRTDETLQENYKKLLQEFEKYTV